MSERRFVVRDLEGWLKTGLGGGNPIPGLSIWVEDDWANGRVIKLWRTENAKGSRAQRLRTITAAAFALCARLNAEHEAALAR